MKRKFTITLKENGIHSLDRGLEIFNNFEQSKDEYLLKEAIMFLHNGIELLMKQVLVEKAGEYLIYADISEETTKKVINAKKQNISVFNLPKPPHTATYLEVISRVRAFVNNPELEESLETRLKDLNSIRNNIEHYAIDEEIQKTEELVVKVRKPLLEFFRKGIRGFKQENSKQVSKKWEVVSRTITEYELIEKEIFVTIQKFNGQKIPGELLGYKEEIILPKFESIFTNYRSENVRFKIDIIDILAENENEKWVFEVKNGFRTQKIADDVIDQIKRILSHIKAKSWVIVFNEISPILKEKFLKEGIYISSLKDWNRIKAIIENT